MSPHRHRGQERVGPLALLVVSLLLAFELGPHLAEVALDPVREVPRYLNADLSLNRAAIWQAADAWARGRFETAGQPRSYRVGRKVWPMKVRTLDDLRLEALIRFEGIAKGMQASERHFRRLDAAEACA